MGHDTKDSLYLQNNVQTFAKQDDLVYAVGAFPMIDSVDSPILHEDLVVESSYGSNMNGKGSSNR